MNVVSFETAKKLKEARFQQPEFNEDDSRLWWCVTSEPRYEFLIQDQFVDVNDFEDVVYAPTATELLPDECELVKEAGDWAVGKNGKRIGGWDANPAEAAAQAWLYVNSK